MIFLKELPLHNKLLYLKSSKLDLRLTIDMIIKRPSALFDVMFLDLVFSRRIRLRKGAHYVQSENNLTGA